MLTKKQLKSKWWHRLAVVIFVVAEIVVFILGGLLGGAIYYDYNDSLEKIALESFEDYNGRYQKTDNSLNDFFDEYENVGCYDRTNDDIDYISRSGFDDIFCNPDIENFVDYVFDEDIQSYGNYSRSELTELIESTYEDSKRVPYCTSPSSYYSCSSNNLVSYNYIQPDMTISIAAGLGSGIVGLIIVGLFLYIIYRYGILYIAFGRKH